MTTKTIKPKSTLNRLRGRYAPLCDTVSRKAGVYTLRRGYFYTFGKTTADLVADLKRDFPEAKVTGSGDHWAAFNGAAPLHKSSHWWVTFTMPEEASCASK